MSDHRLTTETPWTNGDKGGQARAKFIVFVDLFDCYLRSGRRDRRYRRCGRAVGVSSTDEWATIAVAIT